MVHASPPHPKHHHHLLLLLLLSTTLTTAYTGDTMAPDGTPPHPNFLFLVCESTDGRTWQRNYQNSTLPLPHLRSLEDNGATSFHRHYSNTPVCCPSRATFWSGRHAHHIPHVNNNITVDGAWNNYEGLPLNYSQRIDQVLAKHGYNTAIFGKEDWSMGSHSLNVRLNSWTMYTRFPYDQSNGGWHDETPDCSTNGTVKKGNASAHQKDWDAVHQGVNWLHKHQETQQHHTAQTAKPFFLYQGMNIVHPPYVTNDKWYNTIDPKGIRVPEWAALDTLHPCDLQSSMLKGCIPSQDNASAF